MRTLLFTLFFLLFLTNTTFADSVFVTLDTSSLTTSGNGPYTLDFQFIDGDGTGDANNTVVLSNFLVTAGSVGAPSYTTGGVSIGSNPLSVTMIDSSFFNEAQLPYTPGATVSFEASYTTNPDTVAPDALTFAILDGNGNEIPTTNPNYNDAFVEIDLPTTNSSTAVMASASSDSTVPAPLVVPVPSSSLTSAPEPATLLTTAGAVFALFFVRRRLRTAPQRRQMPR